MYRATTDSISVTVKPIYLEEQSSPTDSHYVWAYQVRIENSGPETVQLLKSIGRGRTIIDRLPSVMNTPSSSSRIHNACASSRSISHNPKPIAGT